MYTQCPECEVAFRVTARILQQANGNVRCGGCDKVFNALTYLSEDMPGQAHGVDEDERAQANQRLLATLDELAGRGDVLIEDTGMEWQVLDVEESGDPSEELRFDDNTPLPEEFGEEAADEYVPPAAARPEDWQPAGGEIENRQGGLALSKPEDWTDLLDEFGDPDSDMLEVEEELAAIHNQLAGRQEPAPRPVDDGAGGAGEHSEAVDFELTAEDEAAAENLDLVLTEAEAEVDLVLDDEAADPDVVLEEVSAEPDMILEQSADEAFVGLDDYREPMDESAAADSSGDDALEAAAGDEKDASGGWPDAAAPGAAGDAPEAAAGDEENTSGGWPDAAAAGDEEDASGGWPDAAAPGAAGDAPEAAAGDEEDGYDAPVLTVQADGSEFAEPEKENPDLYVPPPTDEEMTVNMEIDQELLAAAGTEDDFSATLMGVEDPEKIFEQRPEEVETIIMEGEFVRTAMDRERIAADRSARDSSGEFENLADTYTLTRGQGAGRRLRFEKRNVGMSLLAVLLVLTLAAQVIHSSRETLATFGLFNRTVAPLYRMLGVPVTPEWDVRGWQFEATSGSVDDEETVLTIVSRIGNRSDKALPYPLIHVSLTDRYEEIMGSRILEPGEYLASDSDPSRAVLPGDNFTAAVIIQEPSSEATGFKLNVCYRVVQGTVRCADEDFKN